MKACQLWLISRIEKSSKSFEREHQVEALILAISTWVDQEQALFWNVCWLCSNQNFDKMAFTAFNQINFDFFLRMGNEISWTTFS